MHENSTPNDLADLFERLVEDSLPGRRGGPAWRALLQAHATLMRQLHTDLRQKTGLRLADFDVLAQLADAGGQLRMTELAARALLSRSGLTRRAARLIAASGRGAAASSASFLARPRPGLEPASTGSGRWHIQNSSTPRSRLHAGAKVRKTACGTPRRAATCAQEMRLRDGSSGRSSAPRRPTKPSGA
jgi:hypothetical protein